IFNRCGLRNFPVEADTGVIGGNHSHEFMVPAETGENDVVYCEACGYAANIEKATSGLPKTAARELGAAVEKFATPGVVTIEALGKAPYSVPANRQIKTLVYIADSHPLIILVRGDDQLNETKLLAKTGAVAVRPANAEEIVPLLGAKPGSLGAVVNVPATVKVIADERLRGANDMTTGANEDGFHLRNVSMERDVKVSDWFDLRTVTKGEPCAKCGQSLKIQRAIEVGHVFKLGTKYSEKLNANFLDAEGKSKPCVMGCYGIGVTRTLQAVIEQCNDKDGIVWPVAVAPFAVCITPLVVAKDSPVMQLAEKIYTDLTAAGIEVILDDRDDRPGVKFKDADLVGFPLRLGIGEKSMAKGEVEFKPRGGELTAIKADEVLVKVREFLASRV
ncbi:MAG: proline--tRNA ligase, partial [Verrucomicrobia bacterium]|nr:proline--tRNA ligase [Verrucomicrobiota bacterium]